MIFIDYCGCTSSPGVFVKTTRMTASPRRNILLINLSLLTDLAVFFLIPLPVLRPRSVHIYQTVNIMSLIWSLVYFSNILQDHVKMPIKGLHSSHQFSIISTGNQDLVVRADGLGEQREGTSGEFILFKLFQLLGGQFRAWFIYKTNWWMDGWMRVG